MTSSSTPLKYDLQKDFVYDFFSSVVVFLVALPLCMGIAIACNLPPALGIITGIIGGLLVGPLSGSPLQVSGPAAGLVVIVLELVRQHGMEKMSLVILLAGLIQVVAGFSKLAQWFRAVPPSVVNGMLSGIGVLIFASQFHVMVDDSPKGSGIQNLLSIPFSIWKGIVPGDTTTHHIAAPVGLATILVILGWNRFVRGKLKLIPGSLVAVIFATIIATSLNLPIKRVSLPQDLTEAISFPPAIQLSWLKDKEVLLDALAVALVATAETLLTATALDKMHRGARTNYDRELLAQGVGNSVCGALGVLPMTGVMVRSSVNVTAGARSRLSAFLHGLWLLLFVTLLPQLVRLVPVCSLAALLVHTGWKLADLKIVAHLRKFGRSEVAIYAATVITIISVDLLTGVLTGIALSIAKLLYIFCHLEIHVAEDSQRNRIDVSLKGSATFLNLPRVAAILEDVKSDSELHFHLEGLEYIDHACLDLLMNWDKQQQSSGGSLVIDWGTLGTVFKDRRRRGRETKTKEFRREKLPATSDPN